MEEKISYWKELCIGIFEKKKHSLRYGISIHLIYSHVHPFEFSISIFSKIKRDLDRVDNHLEIQNLCSNDSNAYIKRVRRSI